jgi:hypothetical protein
MLNQTIQTLAAQASNLNSHGALALLVRATKLSGDTSAEDVLAVTTLTAAEARFKAAFRGHFNAKEADAANKALEEAKTAAEGADHKAPKTMKEIGRLVGLAARMIVNCENMDKLDRQGQQNPHLEAVIGRTLRQAS